MTSRFVFSYFQDYKFARTVLVDDFRILNGTWIYINYQL